MLPDNEIELLAKILCDGNPTKTAHCRAEELINNYGCLSNIVRSASDVGVNLLDKERERLSIFCEAARASIVSKEVFNCSTPSDVSYYLKRHASAKEEMLFVFGLDSQNNIICELKIASGWETGINIHPRQIFTKLVREGVGRFILAHNHPSGNINPSYEDIDFTQKVKIGAEALQIDLLDHVIVGINGFYSMRGNRDAGF